MDLASSDGEVHAVIGHHVPGRLLMPCTVSNVAPLVIRISPGLAPSG